MSSESPINEPPTDEPPANEPPADEPPANESPADEPSADEPPANEPPVNSSQEDDANKDPVDVSFHVNETSAAEFMDGQKENRKDSILSDGEISDDSLPPPDTSQEPTATQGELVFEEGLSGITLSVDRQEEALLTPDSREEGELESDGEVISEREDVEKEEGEQTDEDPHQKAVAEKDEDKDDDEDDTPACKFFLQGNCLYGYMCRFRHDCQELKPDAVNEDGELIGKGSPKSPREKESDQVALAPPFPPPIPFPPMLTPGMPPPLLPPFPPFPPFPPTLMPPFFPSLPVPPPATPTQLPTPTPSPAPEKEGDGAQKASGDEKESDDDKLQEQHWLKGLKTGRTAYTVANRRRELALTEPLEVLPDSSPEVKPKKRWAKRSSRYSKLHSPGYSPEYPDDDPQYSAFATFTEIPEKVKSRSPKYTLPHSRRRTKYIGSPDSDHIWRNRRRRSSDHFLSRSGSHSRSEREDGSRSPLSHLTITSRSSSCSSTFVLPPPRPDVSNSPLRLEAEEIVHVRSPSHSSSSSSTSSSSSDSSSEVSSDSSSLSDQSSIASSQLASPGHDPDNLTDGASPLPKKLKMEKAIKASYGSDISDDEFGMSDEEGGRKDSKKYKELSKDRPSISFSLGRTKLKSHSEFTGKKSKKLAVSSPEMEDDSISNRKQDLPKKYEIIEAAKKEAREKKEQKLMKRKMKIAKMKFVKPKVSQDNGANSTNPTPAPAPSDASFQHKIKVERVAPPESKPAPLLTPPSDTPAMMLPSELSLAKEISFEKGLPNLKPEKSAESDKVTPTLTQALPPPPQVQMFTTGSNRSTSDGRALSYKQKLLRSNLADTRRDDSHLKLDAGRNNRMGRNHRGRGGKMIVNKDGSTTMVSYQRDGPQQMGGVQQGTAGPGMIPKAYSGNNNTTGRTDVTGTKQKSGTRKHESHSKKKDLAEWKEKLMKDLESINAQINEKAQDLT